MSRKRRFLLMSAAGVCGFVLLAAGIGFYALQTRWFKEGVRQRIISTIEESSGGRVEFGSFTYDWHSLSANLTNLVVHGLETGSAPPLFRSDSLHVRLKVMSLVRRHLDVLSITVEHPEIHLLFRSDGTTNIPVPKVRRSGADIMEHLLSLKLQHFALNDGTIQIGVRRIAIAVRGENLRAVVNYKFSTRRYDFSFASRNLHIDSGRLPGFGGDLEVRGEIGKDQVLFQHLGLRSGTSIVESNGSLLHFSDPNVDFTIQAQVPAAEVSTVARLPELRGGEMKFSGRVHYNRSTSVELSGSVSGHNLAYRSRSLTFSSGEFGSHVSGTVHAMRFTHLFISALGSKFEGNGRVNDLRETRVDGRISGLTIRELGRLYVGKPVSWSGIASGPVHVTATLERNARNLAAEGELAIAPGRGGVPVSGNVGFVYRERGDVVELKHSDFEFPHAHLLVAGTVGKSLKVALDSKSLEDLEPALSFAPWRSVLAAAPLTLNRGSLHFYGTVAGPAKSVSIEGNVALARFPMRGQTWDELRSEIKLSPSALGFNSLEIHRGSLRVAGGGRIGLTNWAVRDNSPLQVQGRFSGADSTEILREFLHVRLPMSHGIAAGSFDVKGTAGVPSGHAHLTIDDLDVWGARLDRIDMATAFGGEWLEITNGQMQAGPALASFSGRYQHVHGSWREGQVRVKVDSNGFPLASLPSVRSYNAGLSAKLEIHAEAAAQIVRDRVELTEAAGKMMFRSVAIRGSKYGDIAVTAASRGTVLEGKLSGDLRGTQLNGTARVQLIPGTPMEGELHLDRLDLETLREVVYPGYATALPVHGFLRGGITFGGSLESLAELHSTIRVEQMEVTPLIPAEVKGEAKPGDLIFRNSTPFVLEASNGVATIRDFQIVGKDTRLGLSGSIPYFAGRTMNLRAHGALDLRIFELFDSNAQSSGESQIEALISGPVNSPSVTGTLAIKNGSFSLQTIPNGLTGVNGTVRFDRDRATIQNLTAHTGGGDLSVIGFVSFGAGGPLVYRLEANAGNVRLHYAGGISVTANSGLRLTGTSKSSLLAGTVSVSQITLNPTADLGSLLARGIAPTPAAASESSFMSGLKLDIHVESAPALVLNTTLSRDVEAEIDLRVRGTPDRPVVLGNVSANQGDIKVFGAKYSINRGQVSFTNPIKIEPVLDLDLQTQTRGITVDITISGTPSKLNINYRSDPPLQPRDIVALLTVGRAPNIASDFSSIRAANDLTALQSGANTVLGQAISPASNRLSKLFGIANIKIDPLVQGITNTPQARLTVEQQMSRDITVTYITNLSQTSEQIFRFEWALSRQYSVIALRDDNGEFGIDIQYKKRFK